MDYKTPEIERQLQNLILFIEKTNGQNPFDGLEKSLRIVKTRNYNYFPSILKKIGEVVYLLYNMRLNDTEEILNRIENIRKLLTE